MAYDYRPKGGVKVKKTFRQKDGHLSSFLEKLISKKRSQNQIKLLI
jgi:hypothetical protein